MSALFMLTIGFIIGYFYRQSKIQKQHSQTQKKPLTYSERQKAKVMYASDADRIRELNQLSRTETQFMRLLQHEFINHHVIIKNKRFYIADHDNQPIAIFEYRDGKQPLKSKDIEDGIPLFLYKAILSEKSIKEDKEIINSPKFGS